MNNDSKRFKCPSPPSDLENVPDLDDEDAQFALEVPRSASFGTARQWAEMQPDLSILVDLRQVMENGATGRSEETVMPDYDEYESLKTAHGLSKPGDRSFIHLKLVEGDWIIQEEQK